MVMVVTRERQVRSGCVPGVSVIPWCPLSRMKSDPPGSRGVGTPAEGLPPVSQVGPCPLPGPDVPLPPAPVWFPRPCGPGRPASWEGRCHRKSCSLKCAPGVCVEGHRQRASISSLGTGALSGPCPRARVRFCPENGPAVASGPPSLALQNRGRRGLRKLCVSSPGSSLPLCGPCSVSAVSVCLCLWCVCVCLLVCAPACVSVGLRTCGRACLSPSCLPRAGGGAWLDPRL